MKRAPDTRYARSTYPLLSTFSLRTCVFRHECATASEESDQMIPLGGHDPSQRGTARSRT